MCFFFLICKRRLIDNFHTEISFFTGILFKEVNKISLISNNHFFKKVAFQKSAKFLQNDF